MNDAASLLPMLRPDLELLPGPDDPRSAPTWLIHDPVRSTFEKASWVQAQILSLLRVPMTMAELLDRLHRTTTVRVSERDVQLLCQDAQRKGLTVDSAVSPDASQSADVSLGRRLLRRFQQLVYFRVPLIHPDRFLERTVPFVRHLVHPICVAMYLVIACVGVFMLVQRLPAYLSTISYFFSAWGAFCSALTIICMKVIHEFAHAYTARHFGCRVPTMGVAMILLFPVAYSDVTDSWRLTKRRRRLAISLAGVLAELVIAGQALFLWSICPPGILKSMCVLVSSVTIISSLLVNLNPVMRFDGYYVLSDLSGIDNLMSRSFALARWKFRQGILGMPLECPEREESLGRRAFMISYAVAAFAYRLTLYCGIALMMYHWVAKVVGIVLMVTALFVFLVQPVVNELTAVTKLRGLIRLRPRLVLTMIGLIALLLWLALPLPRRCSAPACTIARSTQVIYTPHAGTIAQIAIQPGQHVESGDMVLQLTSDQLDADQRIAELAHERLELELTAIRAVPESRSLLPEKAEALARAEARIRSLTETRSGYSVRAAVSGNVEDLDEHLQPGMAVPAGYHCGRITTPGIPHAVAYITEARAEDLQVDDEVTFISNAQPMRVTGRVLFVEAVQAQNIEQLALTSLTGGPIAVTRDARGKAVPNQAYYRAEIELTTPAEDMRFDQAGRIWFRTKPKSYLADLFSYLYRIVIRESGL